MAITEPTPKFGVYDICFSDKSLSSNWLLYHSMGHELIHVAHKVTLGMSFVSNYSEYVAHMWNYLLNTEDEWHMNKAKSYFDPDDNPIMYNNVVKPNYSGIGNFGIYHKAPRFVYF